MKTSLSLMFVLCMLVMGCEHDDGTIPICIRGTVIGYEHCNHMALIKIEDGPRIGKAVSVSGVQYDNVVKAPVWIFENGTLTYWYGEGGTFTMFFRFRKFVDYRGLMYMTPCPDNIPVTLYDVPTITITQYGLDGCPELDIGTALLKP